MTMKTTSTPASTCAAMLPTCSGFWSGMARAHPVVTSAAPSLSRSDQSTLSRRGSLPQLQWQTAAAATSSLVQSDMAEDVEDEDGENG
jgi:hypothetical protein